MTMATRLTPIFALRQYMALLSGSGLLVARVRSDMDDGRTRLGWRVMPYWLSMDRGSIGLAPLIKQHDEFLRECGWRELRPWLERRGWYGKQPWFAEYSDAWAHAQRMRHCAVPLSGEGAPDMAYLTEDEAWEILQQLQKHLTDIIGRLESWESEDAVRRIGELR